MKGSLVITRAYPALYLGGTPSQETGTSPPSCLLLENHLYTYTTDWEKISLYTYNTDWEKIKVSSSDLKIGPSWKNQWKKELVNELNP